MTNTNITDTKVELGESKNNLIVVELDEEQRQKATSIAQMRIRDFPKNSSCAQLLGARAEVGVTHWLASEGFQMDEAYSDPGRYQDADIYVGKFGIDVKARSADTEKTEGFWIRATQNLERIQCLLWCCVRETKPPTVYGAVDWNWNPSVIVEILGWSTPNEIRISPIESCKKDRYSEETEDRYMIYEDLRPIDSLLDELRRTQKT